MIPVDRDGPVRARGGPSSEEARSATATQQGQKPQGGPSALASKCASGLAAKRRGPAKLGTQSSSERARGPAAGVSASVQHATRAQVGQRCGSKGPTRARRGSKAQVGVANARTGPRGKAVQ